MEGFPVDIKNLSDFGPIPEVEEDGQTFDENAYKKSSFTARVLGFPALAEAGNELIQIVDYRLKYKATDKIESSATFRTQQIYSAIYDDMTFEELQSEFARIIEPTVRDLLNEKEKEKKKKKETKSKKVKKNK